MRHSASCFVELKHRVNVNSMFGFADGASHNRAPARDLQWVILVNDALTIGLERA
jgi:hypothetical protein